jgi:hypothetical protein
MFPRISSFMVSQPPNRRTAMPILRLAALALLTATATHAVDVYIVAGQSNGWRISQLRPGNAKGAGTIHYVGMHCVSEPTKGSYKKLEGVSGMGTGLATSLSKLSNEDIVFIQYCRCGAGTWNKAVNGWHPGDDPRNGKTFDEGLFASFQKYVAHARGVVENDLKLKWEVKALFWHQGESDSVPKIAEGYEKRLDDLFYRFRQELGEDLPIICGQVRQLNDNTKIVNDSINRLAADDPLIATIEVQDLSFEKPGKNGKPNVHFNGPGCHKMGERLAAAYAKLRKK